MRIKAMPSDVAECVAAGEVIVRPASVVKELLENSADATAGFVRLEVVDGGHELLRITDDGMGIHPDDLLLSLQSHTTSKLARVEDLNRICTYGFRGEALASIRAVSRLRLASAVEDGRGMELEASGDRIGRPVPLDMPRGTRVEVRDLFFNVPARRKFLGTPGADHRQIRRVFHQFALARPEMSLELHAGNRRELHLDPAGGRDALKERLLRLVGKDWGEGLVPLEASAAGMELYGWMGSPDRLQSRQQHQYFMINDRPVFDKLLASAARSALGVSIGRSAHPLLAVWLRLEPAHLDVNVHPAKAEVRFLYPRAVHGLMREAVTRALAGTSPARRLKLRTEPSRSGSGTDETKRKLRPAEADSLWVKPGEDVVNDTAPTTPPQSRVQPELVEQERSEAGSLEHMALGSALAQLHDIFILAQNSQGLVIVDAHAAHERCLFEKAQTQMAEGSLAVQPLLTPLHLEVGASLADVVEESGEQLQKLGLEIDRTGESAVAVRAIPSLLRQLDTEELVRTTLSDLAESGHSDAPLEAVMYLVGNLCCRAAIRAGMKLSRPEMDELLRSMERLAHSSYCNHGRPSWYQVSLGELNRLCHRGR